MMDHLAPSANVHEVEITYSHQALLEKIQAYGLKEKFLCSKLKVNLTRLAQVEISHENQADNFLKQLCQTLKQWKPSQNFEAFTAQINQLVFLWSNAIYDGTSIQSVLNLLKCFELKSGLGISHAQKVQLLLFHLLAETSQQYQQYALDYVLNYDSNTQLPNANQIIRALDFTLMQAKDNHLIGLFSLHFQATGNKLTFSKLVALDLNKQISKVLQQNINADCQLYFSGDSQFDILISNLSGEAQLNLLAAKISRAFEQMLFLNFQSILVSPYIGCAYTSAQLPQDLYTNSKLALDSAIAKQQPFVIYSEELENQLLEQNNVEAKVLEAFGSDNLTLFLQPIVNLKNGKCAGAELLLRWSERFGYDVYPSLTIEILNKVGKGKLFTRWLINSACRFANELIYTHNLNIYLTLNLRAEDLYDMELPHLLAQSIALWKLDAKDLILEITENGILEYNESSNSVISQLAELGFKFALDDFGTGFSSLSRLRAMPIHLIKIDQSFVRNVTHSRDDFEIVQSIAMLAKSLGKEVLAEGVEDEACLALIKKLEIDKCQGYYYSKPMSFEQFVDWAKAH